MFCASKCHHCLFSYLFTCAIVPIYTIYYSFVESLITNAEMRFNQLLDEQDHSRCKEGNKKALLAEKLERLRALRDELAKDDWMFDSKR